MAGFRQALQEKAIPLPEERVITSALSIEAGLQVSREFLSRPDCPTALFSNNNLLTLGALQTIRELGLHCPEEVALVGFDDHPWAVVSDPPLTVVRQPTRQLGQIAAQMLLALISGEQPTKTRIILDCELVKRQSS